MNKPAPAQEPSMEEILASIRRIISDEPSDTGQPQSSAGEENETVSTDDSSINEDQLDELFLDNDEGDDLDSAVMGDNMGDEAHEDVAAELKDEEDVLDLTDELAVDPQDDDEFANPEIVEAITDIDFLDELSSELGEVSSQEEEHYSTPESLSEASIVGNAASLLSNESNAAATAAFDSLARTILSKNARTLEDLVQDMLRPMLKSWLDENLPPLVERLVRAEIERVSRGR